MNWEIKKNVKLDVTILDCFEYWIETYTQIDIGNITQILKTADPIRNCISIRCISDVTNKGAVVCMYRSCVYCVQYLRTNYKQLWVNPSYICVVS